MSEQKLLTYGAILIGGAALAWMVASLSGPGETSAPNPSLPSPPNDAQRTQFGGLLAVVDPNWIRETPSSSMRLAQFRLPSQDEEAEDAELAVFSGIGGSVQENLDRWFGQFKQPDGSDSKSKARVQTFNVGGMNTTIADLTGTFTGGGMPMSQPVEKPEFRLLAAIVEGTAEPYYFKLVGPRITVEHWAETFGRFIGTLRSDSR
ncbi:MAG: hypothetical protein CMG71_04565 [Candidatus Marinimicrobia bacterium]|nr:hypothetical protein [Candidatus Neomarinimicrobiota bacterium]|tara:strand:+ start:1725 stop:2339 length:615 start_codon:yes stop_codon:yes gene_type:complete